MTTHRSSSSSVPQFSGGSKRQAARDQAFRAMMSKMFPTSHRASAAPPLPRPLPALPLQQEIVLALMIRLESLTPADYPELDRRAQEVGRVQALIGWITSDPESQRLLAQDPDLDVKVENDTFHLPHQIRFYVICRSKNTTTPRHYAYERVVITGAAHAYLTPPLPAVGSPDEWLPGDVGIMIMRIDDSSFTYLGAARYYGKLNNGTVDIGMITDPNTLWMGQDRFFAEPETIYRFERIDRGSLSYYTPKLLDLLPEKFSRSGQPELTRAQIIRDLEVGNRLPRNYELIELIRKISLGGDYDKTNEAEFVHRCGDYDFLKDHWLVQ